MDRHDETQGGDTRQATGRRLPPMQRQAARILGAAWTDVPLCTVFGDIDVSAMVAFRERLKASRAAAGEGPEAPTISHVLYSAAARAAAEHPQLNAHLSGDSLSASHGVDMGLAIALPTGGLIAPVLRGAEAMDVIRLAREARELTARALSGKLTVADMTGATFTVSSAGRSRTPRYATPLVVPPQVAILAATAVRAEPVVRDGEIVVAQMLPVSLSFDHRALNGAAANAFLDTLSDVFADPEALMRPAIQGEAP